MPYFADLLLQELRSKKEDVLKVLKASGVILEKYQELFSKRWLPLDALDENPNDVYAVDSSNGEVELSGGGVILFTRSLAIAPNGGEVRRLRLDAFYPRRVHEYEDYRRLVREYMEHEVALKAVEEGARYVLIDGSLYGRMLHALYELDIEDREGFTLEYVRNYGELLSKATLRGTVLVGVSKDSRSTLFKEEVLRSEILSHVSSKQGVSETVKDRWEELRRQPHKTMRKLESLVKEGLIDDYVYGLFKEARSAVPDSKVISLLNFGVGFSTPLLLRVDKVYSGTILLILREEEGVLINKLEESFPRLVDKLGYEFEGLASEVIRSLKAYPHIVTFYAVLEEGDDPIRVDIVFPEGAELEHERFLSDVPDVVRRVLGLLQTLYAGRRWYNMLLLEADRKVKMAMETLDSYARVLMKEYDELIVHSRGERRVFYP